MKHETIRPLERSTINKLHARTKYCCENVLEQICCTCPRPRFLTGCRCTWLLERSCFYVDDDDDDDDDGDDIDDGDDDDARMVIRMMMMMMMMMQGW